MRKILLVSLIVIVGVFAGASADVPETMSYQGVLTDGAGAAVPDGTYNLTFRIYDVPSGGSALWTETQNNVQVTGGIFNVVLGSVNALSVDFDVPYWLGVSVNGGAELTPRLALTSSPYSLNADQVRGSGNIFPSSGSAGIGTLAPVEKLDIAGGLRIGNTSGTNAGTIRWTGSDFEGYDGGTWKSLTGAGGGALPPGSAGQTLRHDGSNWVATSNLYNSGSWIGIGSTTPATDLHIRRDVNGMVGLRIENQDLGSNSVERLDFANEDGTLAAIAVYDDNHGVYPSQMRMFNNRPGGSLHFLNPNGALLLNTDGSVEMSNSSGSLMLDTFGELALYQPGVTYPGLLGWSGTDGGNVDIYDENGNWAAGVETDIDGEGGWMGVASGPFSLEGIFLNGNAGASSQPELWVVGTSRSAVFDVEQSGDASVALPSSSVSSPEILDESGAAANGGADSAIDVDGTTFTTLLSRSITVPAAGYVYVVASAQGNFLGDATLKNYAAFGVSDNATSLASTMDVGCGVPAGVVIDWYIIPITCQGIFSVTQGTHTFYFLGRETVNTSTTTSVNDVQLSLIYIPTAYGTVNPLLASAEVSRPDEMVPVRGGMTSGELAAERAESEAANQARMDAELAKMRAEIEALKEELRQTLEKQRGGQDKK